jgi:hypothetical protein
MVKRKYGKRMKKLSAYTHARYCSDIADVTAGIDEVTEAIERRRAQNRAIPDYYYIRFAGLCAKLKRLKS